MPVLGPNVERADPASSPRPVSIRDVARVAGVSRQTVSRVINQHPSLRPDTRDRVLAVIEELQYQPNRMARALGSRRSGMVGVIVAARDQYGPWAAIRAIEEHALAAGFRVNIVTLVSNEPAAIREALISLLENRVEGIVVIAPQTPVLHQLAELASEVPYVLLHSRGADESHQLFVDQLAGARLATRHLLDLGHRRIRYLGGPQNWLEARTRLRAFTDEMVAAGLPISQTLFGDWTAESGYRAGRRLAEDRGLTAVLAGNDQMALGLIHALREVGLDVPGDISVCGFDDIPEAAHYQPPLTTVRQDFAELGRTCVARLMAGGGDAVGPASVTPTLVVRESTAPPSR